MAINQYLNPFFNNYNYSPQQELLQDLLVQAIQIYGIQAYYIPRNIINFDKIYEMDDQSTYTDAIQVPIYLEDSGGQGFQGQDLFTKFGLEIRDQIILSLAHRTFDRVIKPISGTERPLEGDLVYFALNKKCFQIKFTNNKEIFYSFGILPLFQMTLELFEYSDETFNTGIPEIDVLQKDFSLNIYDYSYTTENGSILTNENGDFLVNTEYDEQNIDPDVDTDAIRIDADNIIDWSEENPFGFVEK
jgi:hypothetical protein